jgi:uncharacterized Tic20 family protein
MNAVAPAPADRSLAVRAESLYLLNLTLLPVIAFLALWLLRARRRSSAGALGRMHLDQSFRASLWAGGLLVLVVTLLATLGDLHQPATWIAIVVYVICVHSALILGGVVALSRAMAGHGFRYPLIGPR